MSLIDLAIRIIGLALLIAGIAITTSWGSNPDTILGMILLGMGAYLTGAYDTHNRRRKRTRLETK